ncbi:MAG: acetyl-CoA carboxylase biotin carboxylase subunit [Acidobacteria bacterium]|nr:acetyl-CoA carboxylase biotin carboxylase subunit [Acidobacteriota bacterium]
MFRKVLVSNRGEIAVRILRALRELEIPGVAVYSDADRAALHVRMAGEAAHIGPAPSVESYLNGRRLLEAAAAHGADAIHPGYGFLSENAAFAEACERAGITFIGPGSAAIRRMGSKTSARHIAAAAGAPIVPGTQDAVASAAEAAAVAREIGYPVLLKAAAGGGGKGMRLVHAEDELAPALRDAASEALNAFGSGEIYIEKYLERPRHIEIQVLADRNGHIIHLGERECSLQRRHQKVVEECPSPLVARNPDLRARMGEAAVRIARQAGYHNAGTVEFLADQQGNFYFLEMNTRLQVEHPVTELVTGLDLVHWQIRIAAGGPLLLRQEDIAWNGWALECRIYAEDPDNQFFPCPGRISDLEMPSGPGVRLDSGVYRGWTVPIDYDPLLAKLAVWAPSRDAAVHRMQRALGECLIAGIRTNIRFFRDLLEDERFRRGALDTGLIEDFLARGRAPATGDAGAEAAAILAAVAHTESQASNGGRVPPSVSRWLAQGRARMLR